MKALTVCRKCKAKTMPHRACVSCGTYAGRAVIAMAKPGSKKKHSHKKDAS